jgi:hypothetical protein
MAMITNLDSNVRSTSGRVQSLAKQSTLYNTIGVMNL